MNIRSTRLALLAESELDLGAPAKVLAAAQEAIAEAKSGGCCHFECKGQIALARALLASDGAIRQSEIESALARADHLLNLTGNRGLSPHIIEERGRLAASLGDKLGAERLLREAYGIYQTIGADGHAARLSKELDS